MLNFTKKGQANAVAQHRSQAEQSLTTSSPTDENVHKIEREIGKLLIFINPHSGQGKSAKTFAEKVSPKLIESNISFEVIATRGRNDALSTIMTKTDIGSFNGILVFSGDGLVFEIVNGILLRDDGFKVLSALPIGIIPSGSGNGLLCSVLHKYGVKMDHKSVMNAAMNISTSPTAKAESVALYSVKTDNNEYGAFLSVGWGLMADIDIESESWRKPLGAFRFPVMGFIRSCNLRSYRGRLTYRPYKPREFEPTSEIINVFDNTCQQRMDFNEKTEKHATKWELHDSENGADENDLVVVEDKFVNVYAVTLSHISCEGPYSLSTKLEENKIHLSYILLKDIGSRMDIIRFLLAIEKGEHLNFPFVRNVQVSYLKLDVIKSGSHVVLDGEEIHTTSIEVSSTHNTINVISTSE